MLYNTFTKSLFVLFAKYNERYVRVAAKSYSKEERTYKLLVRKYGPKFDGEDADNTKFSYIEDNFLNGALNRLEMRIKAVMVLCEKYNQTDEQIIKNFQSKNDTQVIHYTNNLISQIDAVMNISEPIIQSKVSILTKYNISEDTLYDALSYHEDTNERKIYLYYYGINRHKYDIDTIIKLIPNTNDKKIKETIKKIQQALPKLIDNIPNEERETYYAAKLRTAERQKKQKAKEEKLETVSNNILERSNFFDHVYNNNVDTEEIKLEKKNIIIDYLDHHEEESEFVKKFYGDTYDVPDYSMKITKTNIGIFNNIVKNVKKYVDFICKKRKTRVYKYNLNNYDKVFKPNKSGFMKRKYYNFDVNVINIKYRDRLLKYIDQYLESINYNTKINTFYDEFGILKENQYISMDEINEFLEVKNKVNEFIKKTEKLYEFPDSLLDIYCDKRTNKEKVNFYRDKISNYITSSPSPKVTIIQKLYNETFDAMNPLVELTNEEFDDANIFLNIMKEELLKSHKMEISYHKRNSVGTTEYFFEFLKEDATSDEEIEKRINIAKDIIANSNSKYKYAVSLFYDEDYKLRSNVDGSLEDRKSLTLFKHLIKTSLANELRNVSQNNLIIEFRNTFDEYINIPENANKELYRNRIRFHFSRNESGASKLFLDKYGENLDQEIDDKYEKQTYPNYLSYYSLCKFLDKFFIKNEYKEYDFPEDYLEQFLTENVDKDLLIQYIEKVLNNKNVKLCNLFKYIYDDNYKLKNNMVLTSDEIKLMDNFCTKINNELPKLNKKRFLHYGQVFESYFDYFSENNTLTEEDKNKIIYITKSMKSKAIESVKTIYGDDFMKLNTENNVSRTQKSDINYVVNYVKTNINNKDKFDPIFSEDLLKRFSLPSDTEEDKNKIKEFIFNYVDSLKNKSKNIFHEAYDENLILVNDVKLKPYDKCQYKKMINKLEEKVDLYRNGGYEIKKNLKEDGKEKLTREQLYEFTKLNENYLDYFINSDMSKEEKEEVIRIVKEFLSISQMNGIKVIKEIYDENLILISPVKLDRKQRCDFNNAWMYLKKNYLPKQLSLKNKTKNLNNTNTIKINRNFVYKENYLDYIIDDSMSDEDKDKTIKLFKQFFANSKMAGIKVIQKMYDENFMLVSYADLTTVETRNMRNVKTYFLFDYLPRHFNDEIKQEETTIKAYVIEEEKILSQNSSSNHEEEIIDIPNMFDLGLNSDLVYKNDLFHVEFIIPENIAITPIDGLLMNAYNEYHDSKTILEILKISEDTLLDFYLNNLDDIEDVSEAFNFILHNSNKNVIKRLFNTPLFVRVLNDVGDLERQVLYLKLIQVNDNQITDELISRITGVDLNTLKDYAIMTKEDKINDLNYYILKKHK